MKKLFCVIAILLAAAAGIAAQNKFEGYSLTVEADESGTCPVKYKPSGSNYVDVLYAGSKRLASDVVACPGSGTTVSLGRVTPNGEGRWCFQGSLDYYEIQLEGSTRYLWYPTKKDTGFFNVKDFRPVVQGAFAEPADYTKTIKNAVAFIASRQGGTLYFPEGDYIVGTTNGTTRNASYTGIALPSGIVIQGASPNASIPTTNLPFKRSPTSIRLRHPNQSIFRISGCTNHVTIKNVELLGNSAGWQEPPRDSTGNYGIEAMGKWEVDPTTQADTPNSSQFFKFENITFQNLDRAIYVHNANDLSTQTCNPNAQRCGEWQFDYVKVDHGIFINNKAGIWINTYNTDWKVTNSMFNYVAPGEGIHLQKGGSMLIEQTFGAGYDFGANIGGPFINIDTFGTLTIINSSTERGQKSLYTNPAGAISTMMIVVVGSHFGDKIELNGRLNYISTGNYYGARTVNAAPGVKITSTGDRFCYDPAVLPGYCRDESNQPVTNPGFNGGKIMFQTGRQPEGSGANLIQRRPNFFGYDVEINDDDETNNEPLLSAKSFNFNKPLLRLGQNYWYDFKRDESTGFLIMDGSQEKPYVGFKMEGLMQMDKNTTFNDLIVYATTVSNGQPLITDGAIVYCKDCAKNASGVCVQGTAGVDGAFAKRINNTWRCD